MEERFAALPEPVRLEDTIAGQDVVQVSDSPNDERRENEWLLKFASG